MGIFRLLLTTVLVMAVPSTALATPIAYDDGMVDGVLCTLQAGHGRKRHEARCRAIARLPRSSRTSIRRFPGASSTTRCRTSRCLQAGLNQSVLNSPPECLSFFFQVTDSTVRTRESERLGAISSRTRPRRLPGGQSWWHGAAPCGFSDKWAFAQSQGWGGIMVVNNAPGPVGVAGLTPHPVEPTIAFMRLTQAVGDQILSDWRAPGGPVVIEMSVTWTPNPDARCPSRAPCSSSPPGWARLLDGCGGAAEGGKARCAGLARARHLARVVFESRWR